jgi:hypothetical protein
MYKNTYKRLFNYWGMEFLTKHFSKLETEMDKFSTEQRALMYGELKEVELEIGCPNGCIFCAYDAPPLVEGSGIPDEVLERLADEINPDLVTRRIQLYGGTDPLSRANYFEVRKMFVDKGIRIVTVTAIPKGMEEMAIANLADIESISISHMNRERLTPFFDRLGVRIYVDVPNYCWGMGRTILASKEDCLVQGSVEETLTRLHEADNSLPMQSAGFYDIRELPNVLRRKVQTRNKMFLYCWSVDGNQAWDLDRHPVENFGRAFDFEPYPYRESGGPVYNGRDFVRITPNGIFNVMGVPATADNCRGEVVELINPDDFKVIKYQRFIPHQSRESKYLI